MPEDIKNAMPLLEEALRLQPDYAIAHALIAWCYELRFARAGLDASDKAAALHHANAALASGTDDAMALAVAGFVTYLLGKDHDAALSAIDRALSLNPSCATALYLGAQSNALWGNGEKAVSFANRALRLSPFDPLAFEAHMAFGTVAMAQEHYGEAASHFGKIIEIRPNFSTGYLQRAVALALGGRAAEAAFDVARGLELEPAFQNRVYYQWGIAPRSLKNLSRAVGCWGFPNRRFSSVSFFGDHDLPTDALREAKRDEANARRRRERPAR